MSKMVLKWIEEALQDGPMTAGGIMETMSHKKSCPTMHQLGNYLAKSKQFEKAPLEVKQAYMGGGSSWVAVWRLRT
tara:strand:- start:1253 stop:1480 length:228 start_codon:yes stop_codon:yes gene_type:complete